MLATSFDEAESGTDDRAENGENLLEMALDILDRIQKKEGCF